MYRQHGQKYKCKDNMERKLSAQTTLTEITVYRQHGQKFQCTDTIDRNKSIFKETKVYKQHGQ